MQRTVLLLSHDQNLSFTRAQILEEAGYQTASSTDVASALALAARVRPCLAVVGHSFSALEQESFVESMQEAHPGICVLLLRFGLLHPAQLLAECEACVAGQSGRSTIRVVEPDPEASGFFRSSVHSRIDSERQSQFVSR